MAEETLRKPQQRKHDSERVSLAEGTWIGKRFEIVRQLGEGGLGQVFLAEDREIGRQVALKFWHGADQTSTRGRARVKRRTARSVYKGHRITHPRVCRIYDFHQLDGFELVAMEYVEGRSLRQVINESPRPLSSERVIRFGLEICEGLAATHDQNLFHQDIKPSNLIVDLHDQIKITDFDIVGTSWRGATYPYAAPEQLQGLEDGSGRPSAASDLFSVGCVLYEMATSQRPFDDKGVLGNPDPPAPSFYVEHLPSELERAIGYCLQRHPADRPQSARSLARLLTGEGRQPRPPLTVGAVLDDRFRIERRLGRGNSGVVFQAVDLLFERSVALKFWNPENALSQPNPDVVREFQKAQDLPQHPRLCRVRGFHIADGYAFAVLELVNGGDLAARLRSQGRLQAEEVCRLALDLCSGLRVIHDAGLVHQNIEPGNLLLTREGRLKIGDLGFAGRHRWWGHDLPYSAPEQVRAVTGLETSMPSPAADFFAVGCVLYEMLTGQQAFPDGCLATLSPVAAGELFQDVPQFLDRAVAACLQRNPERRPQSADQLEALLRTQVEPHVEAPKEETATTNGSLGHFIDDILHSLDESSLILLLLQEHQDFRAALSLLLHHVRRPGSPYRVCRHLTLPAGEDIDEAGFFNRLASQCDLDHPAHGHPVPGHPVHGDKDWEQAIHHQLRQQEPTLMVISGWSRGMGAGLERGRVQLSRVLQGLVQEFRHFHVLLIGGEPLARLKYAGAGAPPLVNARPLFWPEFTTDDILRLATQDFPELSLQRNEAEALLQRCGGHFGLVRSCLRMLATGREPGERIFTDTLWALFSPFRDDLEIRERVRNWLAEKQPAAYSPWPSDATLRRLFWSGALAEHEGQFHWRSEEFQRVGQRALA